MRSRAGKSARSRLGMRDADTREGRWAAQRETSPTGVLTSTPFSINGEGRAVANIAASGPSDLWSRS
jgi:hypothetical protein